MTKRVSIIIHTLNEEKYIGKLLNCLVRQTYKDFEVVVVDGNSEVESDGQISYPYDLAPRGNIIDKYVSKYHKTYSVKDPYRFLEDPESEVTKKWIEA